MSQNSQELGNLDVQCIELHLKIQQFSTTLDRLTEIQNEFVDLSEVYRKLKQDAQELEDLTHQFLVNPPADQQQLKQSWAELSDRVSQLELDSIEIGDRQDGDLTEKQKELIQVLISPMNEQISESQVFILGAVDSKIRKYENQVRELRRDLQNISRIGLIALVILFLGMLVTWLIMSSQSPS